MSICLINLAFFTNQHDLHKILFMDEKKEKKHVMHFTILDKCALLIEKKKTQNGISRLWLKKEGFTKMNRD